MKKILSGMLALALTLATILSPAALADSFPQEAAPGNTAPRVYMIHSAYDICDNDNWGGSQPNGFDLQSDGCIELDDNLRFEEYAFTGEQLYWEIVVRDYNGADDISYAKFTVDGYTEALCEEFTVNVTLGDMSDQLLPEGPITTPGFNPDYDKAFLCVLTVEPSWYGEKMANIDAYDQSGTGSTSAISQSWFFNPAVIIDLDTNNGASSIEYEDGYPGETVFSTNKLVVTNLAEGGVDLWTFIAATDLTDPTHSGAKCPISNVLDIDGIIPQTSDTNMQFRCKIGTTEDDTWRNMANKVNTASCGVDSCVNANPLLPGATAPRYSIVGNMQSAECQFRLHYPVPCIGSFTEGLVHIIVRAV